VFCGTMLDLFIDELDNVQGKGEKKMEAYAIQLKDTFDSLRRRFSHKGENTIGRVIRVSVAVLTALAITFLWVATAKAATKTSTGSANWNTSSTWNPSGVPGAGDSVVIGSSHTVTLNANGTCGAINVRGTLTFSNTNGRTLTVTTSSGKSGNIRISGTLSFGSSATGQSITIGGSFACTGTMNNNNSGLLVFNGTGTKTISNSDNFGTVQVNNSSLTLQATSSLGIMYDLAISAGTLDLAANSAGRESAGGTLTVANGATLIIGGSGTFPANYSTHTIGSTSTIEHDGTNQTVTNESYGNLTLSGSGTKTLSASSMTIAGDLRVTGTTSATPRANLTVNGDLTIDAGASFSASSYTIQVGGDFTVNGTFDPGTGTLTITGSNSTMNADTLNNLTVNSSNGLALGRDQVVKNNISLAGGKLELGSHTLTIESAATVTGVTPSNYIVIDGSGSLKRKGVGSSSVAFPVGTSSSYSPVTISNSGTQADFTVRIDGSFDYPLPVPTKSVNKQWKISKTGGPGSVATVTIQWTGADEAAGFSHSNPVNILHYNGTQWEQFPATFTDLGNGTYSATASGFTSFSPFGVGNDGALPIQMASSAAYLLRGNDVEVTWKTVSETNNYGFEIYRKRGESGEWTKIGFVQGHGTTLAPQAYSFVDRSVSLGKYFYRIKQIDLDGKSETFPPMDVTVGGATDKVVLGQNYPNPFNPSTVIEFAVPMSGHSTMKVYNVLGQEVATLFDGNAEAGRINTARFNASNLPSGLYFYTLSSAGKVESKRMLLLK
jgi:hypothetical protein